jgi:two-component system sensor histidine kinase HydH
MRILHKKKLYLPALSIIAAALILLGLISISTYRNLNREKIKILSFAHRQASMLLSIIETSARTDQCQDEASDFFQEITRHEDVAYIYLFDPQDRIICHSDPEEEGEITSWKWENLDSERTHSRMIQLPDKTRVYEIARRFSPQQSIDNSEAFLFPANRKRDLQKAGSGIVLGLRMNAYDEALRSDLQHAIVMATIVIVLGSAVFFFIFIIQNYYLVERTLRRTQDYTQQVVSSMASGLVGIDPKGKILSFNSTAAGILGLEDPGGSDLSSILDFQYLGIQEVLDRCETVTDREIRFRKPDDSIIPISVSASPIRDENGVCRGAVLILSDRTNIKQLEEKVRRSEKLAAVGQLAAGLAHEIRNPLSSIRGFAQFLRYALKDRPKEQEYAEVMIREMDRINRVVTDLLSFANPRSAELKPTRIEELIDHVVRLVQADSRAKKIDIGSDVSPGLGEIPLDAYQMTQAFLNLLLNSLKFVDPGGSVEIAVSAAEDKKEFIFQVEDNGPGIPKENLTKIFDPFFTTRETGTGLGLAIVHKIVENHRGTIDVESPPSGKPRGCRFTIRIPDPAGETEKKREEA